MISKEREEAWKEYKAAIGLQWELVEIRQAALDAFNEGWHSAMAYTPEPEPKKAL